MAAQASICNCKDSPAPLGVHILGDFCFGDGIDVAGIFIFEKDGLLSGIEVYGLAGDAPATLLSPRELRPLGQAGK